MSLLTIPEDGRPVVLECSASTMTSSSPLLQCLPHIERSMSRTDQRPEIQLLGQLVNGFQGPQRYRRQQPRRTYHTARLILGARSVTAGRQPPRTYRTHRA